MVECRTRRVLTEMQLIYRGCLHTWDLVQTAKENLDQGPVNRQCDRGLSHPSPQTRNNAVQPSLLIREPEPTAEGDSYVAGEAGNTEGSSPDKGLFLHLVHGTEERW